MQEDQQIIKYDFIRGCRRRQPRYSQSIPDPIEVLRINRGMKLMTNREKWNLIVKNHNKLYNDLEAAVQKEWELYCSDLFDYKRLFNEIDTQRNLSVGSGRAIIPDIILKING